MEYIDGETLQDRLKRGRMHWAEALNHLIEIADALAAAHRQGIVHRDLKPANVMLTKGGVEGARLRPRGPACAPRRLGSRSRPWPARRSSRWKAASWAPCRTWRRSSFRANQPTPGPMSLRSARLPTKCLTGKPAFSADSQADLIGAILKDDPESIATSAADVPILLARTIARCLAKDPHERWQTAADLLFQLRSIAESAGMPVQGPPRRRWSHRSERVLWLGAVAASLFSGVYLWGSRGSRDAPPAAPAGVFRFPLLPPKGTTFPSSFDVPFALSPDGRRIAYVAAREDGTKHLWLRSLDSEQDLPLPGTEGATSPFWKPDSEWVAFFSGGHAEKGPRHESGRAGDCQNDVDAGRRGLEPQRRHRVPWSGWAAPRVGEWRTGLTDRKMTNVSICGRSSWMMGSTTSIRHSRRAASCWARWPASRRAR